MTNKKELKIVSPTEIEKKDIELSYTAIYGDKGKTGKLINLCLTLRKGGRQILIELNTKTQSLVLIKIGDQFKREEVLRINFTDTMQMSEAFYEGKPMEVKDDINSIFFPFDDNSFFSFSFEPEKLKRSIENLGRTRRRSKKFTHPIDGKRTNFLPLMSQTIQKKLQESGFDFSLIDRNGREILSFKDSLSDKRR